MKVYKIEVDKLPISCIECSLCSMGLRCAPTDGIIENLDVRLPNCPLVEAEPKPVKLQACPHCGGTPLANIKDDIYYVFCLECRLYGPEGSSRDEAVDLWNRIRIENN